MKTIAGKLMISFSGLVLITLLVLGAFFSFFTQDYLIAEKEAELLAQSEELAKIFEEIIIKGPTEEQLALLRTMDRFLEARLWVVDREGQVIAASRELPLWRGRPQLFLEELSPVFKEVLQGENIISTGQNPVYDAIMMTVGVPFKSNGSVLGAVFLNSPITGIEAAAIEMRRLIINAALLASLIALALSFYLMRVLGSPLQQLTQAARRIAAGDFLQRITVKSKDEIGELGNTLNSLADNLAETLSALEKERDTLEATISSIEEGVLAVDLKGVVILSNASAHRLLHQEESDLNGALLKDLNLHSGVYTSFKNCLQGETVESKVLKLDEEQFILLHTSAIKVQNKLIGVVLLLHDITALERIEKMRRDFVANVSHELRRPLTAIKGFIEAIIDGTVQSENEKQKFLEIILRESRTLEKMVEELLDFAQLENKGEELLKEHFLLNDLIQQILRKMDAAFKGKDIEVIFKASEDLYVQADQTRIEQAIINLLENAVKFAPVASTVFLSILKEKNQVKIVVKDQGPGIATEESRYIWGRFYKGKAGRQSENPGSGLGLSIVDTIIKAHQGEVEVKNASEGGAIFTIKLPDVE